MWHISSEKMKSGCVLLICAGIMTCGTRERMTPGPDPIVGRLTLKPNRPDAKVVRLQQIDRSSHRDQIKIPTFPLHSDEFYQAEETVMKLDILIVVDNSMSMEEEQGNLSTRMEPLLSGIADVDWRMGVINTEWPCFKDSALPFDRSTPNLASRFADNINQGISGSGYEKGIMMGGLNISQTPYESEDPYATEFGEKCTPKAWLRPDAALAVLILADEDEDESSLWKPEDFVHALQEKKYHPGENARVYGIIWRPGTECEEAYQEGFRYAELIALTGGILGDVCAEDYSQALRAISSNFRDLVLEEYELRAVPILRTIELVLDGALYQGQYSLVGNKLILAQPLRPGQRLVVNYKTQEARTLTLKYPADPKTIQITINGEAANRENFTYVAAERRLNFTEPLLEGANVEIQYREDQPLRAEYPFPKLSEHQEVECYHNGRPILVDYDREQGSIRFREPPLDGEEVLCLYMPG